jgi:probable HAF family extracellular repeat protein
VTGTDGCRPVVRPIPDTLRSARSRMKLSLPTHPALRAGIAVAATLAALGACGDTPAAPLASPQSAVLLPAGNAFSFTTIDAPGAIATTPQGISADGAVVGTFRDARGTHGFLFRGGAFTTIDYPGAAVTEARGIARDGTIVGSYRLPGEPAVNFHGFRRTSQGEFVKADYPGHTSTIPQRILDDGTMLGCRHGADQMETMRGVVIGRSANSETDTFASMHNGATPDRRRIVGLYTNMMAGTTGRTEGYVIDDGVFTAFLVPGSTLTTAWDVNPQGDVAGVFRDAAGVFHGVVLTRDGFVSVDERPHHVAGGGNTHGFLARRTR